MTAAIGPLIGAGVSLFTGLKSAAAQKKAVRAQEKQQELADAREKRRLLRQSQIAAGQAVNTAASIGGLGSSGLTGGIMGLQNQVASQVGYQAQSSALAKQASGYMQKAQNWNMAGDILGPLFGKMNFG
jgi:hypothetical protein